MDDETKAKLKEAGLEGVITSFEALTATVADKDRIIAEKDVIITQKTNDVVGARKEYKKLADMTEAEKAAMSEKEIELQQRAEAHEADVAAFQASQAEVLKKEVDARKADAIRKLAGNDKELASKVEANYSRILDHDKAQTAEEVARIVGEAFNMTGSPRPDPLRTAINNEGGLPSEEGTKSFADTAEGKGLSDTLGLPKFEEAAK